MDTDETRMGRHGETTSQIIGSAFEIHNTLGHGFLEKVYRRAMQVELMIRVQSVPIRG
jgi:GxxExxY protein